uniref:Uncharacterized protein n=1 Tax=Tanacetum cinerariifolium TaxID=118510 RepID=A0A6L2JI91_TANCI|nr:hypothetical protein [Tanacetum cinerariifolium]
MPIFKRTFSQDLNLLEQHLTKDILSQTDCHTILIKLRTTFVNAFNSEFKERIRKYTRFDDHSFKDSMIRHMDFIEKYMLETILHQQEIHKLLNEKKLQTQEVQSNTVQALKVDSIVIENTCSGKENSNSETASSKSVKKAAWIMQQKMYMQSNTRYLKGTCIEYGFKRAFILLFGQDNDTFTKISETESKVQDDNSRSRNDTDADDVDIRPIHDKELMAERREFVFAKPDHMIASDESRNSSKNMPRFSSNDMVHNNYLDEDWKKTQEIDKNLKTNVMPLYPEKLV